MSSSTSGSSAVGNIEHVIVLMFENRSFDHILGAMPGVDGVLDPQGNVLPDFYNTMHPTEEPGEDNQKTWPKAIVPYLYRDGTPTEDQLITHDFTHEFGDGMLQDLFGPGTTGVLEGRPQNNPAVTYPATNSGFLSTVNYNIPKKKKKEEEEEGAAPANGEGALTYFQWGSMKVFHTLAQSYLVCDAWHCDMPGHTAPNRAFMHCATTGDLGIDDDDAHGGTSMVNRPSIFEQIQGKNKTWKVYILYDQFNQPNCDTNWLNETLCSQEFDWSHADHPDDPNKTYVPIQRFCKDVEQTCNLPFYSFIMCWNNIGDDTSMHPHEFVEPGENLLACIYNSLRNSPCWANTLLIVNFDENGGMYDHRSVPSTTPPDPAGKCARWHSSNTGRDYCFDFSVLGARIPVILISPWLKAGVCSTQYQNTSILRFLQDSLLGADPSAPYYLTERDRKAPSIAPVFEYAQFGCEEARTDCPVNIEGYDLNGGSEPCAPLVADTTPDAASLSAPPAPHIERVTRKYLGPLPGHPESGKPLTRSFATVGDMLAYAKERREAAFAYIRAKATLQ